MKRSHRISGRRLEAWVLTVVAIGACVVETGCVRRRMTVRTNPPGALVFVDDQEIGLTPVSTPFTYYGTRKIQIVKDGYETFTTKQKFPTPWYQYPVLDFFAENLWPFEVRDERAAEFDLMPQQIVPNEKLMERAEALRQNNLQGQVVPMWSAAPASQQQPGAAQTGS